MKIIAISNFNDDTVSDRLVATIPSIVEAEICLKALQATVTEYHQSWYVMKPDDYKLYTWEP